MSAKRTQSLLRLVEFEWVLDMTSIPSEINLPPDHILRQLLDAITAHPEVREPLLRALLTEDFLTLPKRVDKLQGEFEEFREETRAGFRAVNERIDATNAEVRSLSNRLGDNTRRLDDNTRRLDDNTRAIRRLDGHVGRLIGNTYEDKCRYNIGVILDGWLDGPVVADRTQINSKLLDARRRGAISREEYQDGLNPDIIARGVEDTDQAMLLAVVEASVTFNPRDLETAARRAAVITKVTGTGTAAFIATHFDWPDEVDEAARQLGVTIIRHEDPDYDRGEEIYDSLSGLAQTERPDGQL